MICRGLVAGVASVIFTAITCDITHAYELTRRPRLQLDSLSIDYWEREGVRYGFTVTVDQGQRDMKIVVPFFGEASNSGSYQTNSSRGATGETLDMIREEYDASVALSGGYLKSFAPPVPVGLVIVDGFVVNRYANDALLDAVLCFANEAADILDMTDPVDEGKKDMIIRMPGASSCLQAGPLLVRAGSPVPEGNRTPYQKTFWAIETQRSFVGLNSKNQIVFGVVDRSNMDDLVEWLLGNVSSGGLGLNRAMYLPGGGGGGLVWRDPSGAILTIGNSFGLQANAIVIN